MIGAARRLVPEAEAYSDGCFRRIADAGHTHTVLEIIGGRAATKVRGALWVNVVPGNGKRDPRHLPRHSPSQIRPPLLAEAAYRFNWRFRLAELPLRLVVAMMRYKPCTEPSLRLACNPHG